MSKLTGLSYVTDFWRANDIENAMSYSASFSDVVDSRLKVPTSGLAFISMNGEEIQYVMLFKKSGRVATKKDRINFKKPIKLEPAFSFEQLKISSPAKLKRHILEKTREGIVPLSPNVFSFILDSIKRRYPSVVNAINKLEREIQGLVLSYSGRGAAIIAHEKDAVNLALKIAGFAEADYPSWLESEEPAPFLSGFKTASIREDPMIAHDAEVFGDWGKIRRYVVGATEFIRDNHKLTILNVNRHEVEQTLGVDLLIYHHTYRSYVMIQYKRMIKENSESIYRPNSDTYRSEISRMERFLSQIKGTDRAHTDNPVDYRLNSELFYFKLCPANLDDILSTKMIAGMYIPIMLWKTLIESEETTGPKGGKIFSYNNVKRRLNNSEFVNLVQNGWIGSRVRASDTISSIIHDSISRDNSVLLAKYKML